MSWTDKDMESLRQCYLCAAYPRQERCDYAAGRCRPDENGEAAANEIERLRARIAELEATQTPEHVAAWKHWAKLEGAREEREAVVAWLRETWCPNDNEPIDILTDEIEAGEHEKGEAK
jgi:hypothetical protein